jgi:hypothetical protein
MIKQLVLKFYLYKKEVKKLNKKTQDKQQVIMSFMISKSRSIKREGEGGKMNISS